MDFQWSLTPLNVLDQTAEGNWCCAGRLLWCHLAGTQQLSLLSGRPPYVQALAPWSLGPPLHLLKADIAVTAKCCR